MSYEIVDHSYDVVIVGAGGAGLLGWVVMASPGVKKARASECIRHCGPSGALPGGVRPAFGNSGGD